MDANSFNLLALPWTERLLFGLHQHIHVCRCGCRGRCTVDAVLELMVLSLRILMVGRWPEARHDGQEWQRFDAPRKKRSGTLGFHGFLLQVRGAEDSPRLCGLERATDMLEMQCHEGDHEKCIFVSGMAEAQKSPHDIFLPALDGPERSCTAPIVPIAQLHDGVHRHRCAPRLLLGRLSGHPGSLFWECCGSIFNDKKHEDQVKSLWARIKAWYLVSDTPSKLQNLTLEMVRIDAKPPKLRAKAGETRYLVPFAAELAQELHQEHQTPKTMAIRTSVFSLLDFYTVMSAEPFQAAKAAKATQTCALMHISQSNSAGEDSMFWRVPRARRASDVEH